MQALGKATESVVLVAIYMSHILEPQVLLEAIIILEMDTPWDTLAWLLNWVAWQRIVSEAY